MQFRSPRIVFTEPGKAELQEAPARTEALKPGEVVMETEYSIISPGTELACLAGIEWWAKLPFVPGYGSVGRVIEKANDVKDLKLGQRIFTYGQHAKRGGIHLLGVPLSDSIDPVKATFARMAAVSIASLRVADISLGDRVAIFGLGLVGNLAAQLFHLSGCEVIGIDPSPERRKTALACGIDHVLPPGEDLRERVKMITGDEMCHTVVEATGIAAVAAKVGDLAGKLGEVILLGSPRASYETNLTPFLNYVHSWDLHGCVTYKGAHEWRFPTMEDKDGRGRHSIERNLRHLLHLIEQDKLKIDPLITHKLSPADCQVAYDGLLNNKDVYCGVIFDWSKV